MEVRYTYLILKKDKITDIKKYLPTHLIPNDLILKIDKEKYFGSSNNLTEVKIENPEQAQLNPNTQAMLDKYKDYLSILKDDLRKLMDKNMSTSQEINDTEEERDYYFDKIKNVLIYCEKKRKISKLKQDSQQILDNLIKIITQVPEDFK
jgi:hypothetical protein